MKYTKHNLQEAFTGKGEEFIQAVGEMYKLSYKAIELMRNPIPGKKVNTEPTFEFLTDEEIV